MYIRMYVYVEHILYVYAPLKRVRRGIYSRDWREQSKSSKSVYSPFEGNKMKRERQENIAISFTVKTKAILWSRGRLLNYLGSKHTLIVDSGWIRWLF